MLKLPYKSTPKPQTVTLGNDSIGILEFPKLGGLTPNEHSFIKEATKDFPDAQKQVAALARDIANKSGKKTIEVYDALVSRDTEAILETMGDRLDEIYEFYNEYTNGNKRRRIALATAVLQRLVPEWELPDTEDPAQIHPKLVEAIADFAFKEESGWGEPEPITEEDLGKLPTENLKTQTGRKSSGASTTTGEATSDSVATASASSPSG